MKKHKMSSGMDRLEKNEGGVVENGHIPMGDDM